MENVCVQTILERALSREYIHGVGSKTFAGVWFAAYSDDHPPPHAHGQYAGVRVVVDLLADRKLRQFIRWNAVTPQNGKRSGVRHVLEIARQHGDEVMALWKATHA
jgi:hypothetical protein